MNGFAKPPSKTAPERFEGALDEGELPTNLNKTASAEKTRFMGFRVTDDQFKDIKLTALQDGMKLGDYLVFIHERYKASK